MERLADNRSGLKNHYEIIVIGSGYGGGIAASRLARAGRQVCVLERGREIQPGEYPDNIIDLLKDVQTDFEHKHIGSRTSLFDFRQNQDIHVIAGCGLGGTSLINAGICMRPEPSIFANSQWPDELRDISALEKYFTLAETMLKPSTYSESADQLKKVIEFKCASENNEGNFEIAPVLVNQTKLPNNKNHIGVEQHPCIQCGDCITGCNYRAKNTIIMNYLPDAKKHGAEIYTEITVSSIIKGESLWSVEIKDTRDKNLAHQKITADVVILAAGTLGTNEILLRSAKKGLKLSANLGKRFSGNGDMVSFSYNGRNSINGIGFGNNSTIDRKPVGITSNSIIDFRKAKNDKSLVLIEAAMPGALSKVLLPTLQVLAKTTGKKRNTGFKEWLARATRVITSKFFGAYRGAVNHTLFILAISKDDGQGVMSLKDDRLRISWPGVGQQESIRYTSDRMKDVTYGMGATYIPNPVWNSITNHDLLTGHPLGGCPMANSTSEGVVNHAGGVFNADGPVSTHSGLYIMDGSIVPGSLSINPLLTISALAERNVALLAESKQWDIPYD